MSRVPSSVTRRFGVLLLVLVLAGCGLVGSRQFAAEPGADAEVAPIGPIIEIGSGQAIVNGEFTYSIYESAIGTCTKVEFVAPGRSGQLGCGSSLAIDPAQTHLQPLAYGSATGSGWSIEGLASGAVAEVWVELASGDRLRAFPLMSLRPAGKDGQLFYVETLDGDRPVRIVALDRVGNVIGQAAID